MSGTKFLGFSRALWGMLGPCIALTLEYFDVRDGQEMTNQIGKVAELLFALAGPVCWFLHWRKPDPRTPVLRSGSGPAALSLVCLVGLSGPLLTTGCVSIGHDAATPMQKYYETDQAVTTALKGAVVLIEAIGPDNIPPEVRLALVEAVNKVDALRDPVRDWVESCTTEAGCSADEKARLSIATARVALAETLETYENVCTVKPEGCPSAGKVRLVIRSIAKGVDLAEDVVTEVLSDGE